MGGPTNALTRVVDVRLEFGWLGEDLVRQGHHLEVRVFVEDDLAGSDLVLGVQEGVEKADGDRRDPERAEASGRLANALLVQRRLDLPLGGHALGDLEPDTAAGYGRGRRRSRIPDVLFETSAEFDLVAESFGDEEARRCPLHLDQGVVAGRRPVHDRAGLSEELRQVETLGCGELGEPGQHAVALVMRRGRSLLEDPSAVGPPQHAVGESSPDIDADPVAHRLASLSSFVASRSTASVISSNEPVTTTP